MTLRDIDDPVARASEETRTRQDGRAIWRERESRKWGVGVRKQEDLGTGFGSLIFAESVIFF